MCHSTMGMECSLVLQWLVSPGCAWDGNTAIHAAAAGDLDLLVWIDKSGRPWDVNVCLDEARQYDRRRTAARIEAYCAMAVRKGRRRASMSKGTYTQCQTPAGRQIFYQGPINKCCHRACVPHENGVGGGGAGRSR
ncbi:hypothetical protein psal_cds_777 [Pandoravirus salinus]|uniref:Ankyrin repeat domain containing protein n=1 Tax=Pandoravirus salinus TaxID=1349410 RepID=A0A291ATX1_9VIRU|nr:hypothetical protein psal_cds_777 [Pandoravirus salinus]ATE82228.1 hypothetical protein psal_cds_777 [Pandoravirus salinus]